MSANTSPDNITYPVSTDNVSPLETVFANMASSIQTAITNTKTYHPADLTALYALTGMVSGAGATVLEGTSTFVYNGTIWVQSSIATFATTAARDSAYAKASSIYKTTSATCIITGTGQLFEYITTATTPDWYHVGGRPTLDVIGFTGIYVSSSTSPTKVVTQAGRANLEGAVVSSTSATFVANTLYTIGTLPAALAPLTAQSFTCSANNTFALALVSVDTSGNITFILNTGFTAVITLPIAGSWRLKGL